MSTLSGPVQFRRQDASAIALLLVLVAAIYGQTAGFEFTTWDDPSYVTDNFRVKAGLTGWGFEWALTATYFSNWHPLTWLSHMAAYQAFGDWAGGHHLVNVALHAANTVLCYLFFRAFGPDRWRPLLVAVLFAVHPMHVETVVWISDRKGLLAALFWWLALLTYIRYVRLPRASTYVLLLAVYAAALMSKPMAVTLPLVLILLDYWPLARLTGADGRLQSPMALLRVAVDKVPLLLMAVFAAVVTVYAQDRGGAVVSPESLAVIDRVANAFVAVTRYLELLLFPHDLTFYFRYAEAWQVWRLVLAIGLVGSLCFVSLWLRRHRPAVLVGWLWFLVMLMPVIGIVQVGGQALAARYMYLTSTGIFMALAWGVRWEGLRLGRWHRTAGLAAIVVLVAYAVAAARQAATWRNSETLFKQALAVDRDNFVAHLLFSEYLLDQGRIDEAEPHARRALALNDGLEVRAYGIRALGRIALARGRVDDAVQLLASALAAKKISPVSAYFLALAQMAAGRLDEAEGVLGFALALRPTFSNGLAALAELRDRQGRGDEADGLMRRALESDPGNARTRLHYATYLERRGRAAEALAEYRAVLRGDAANRVARIGAERLSRPAP